MAMDRRRGSGYLPLRDAMEQLFEGSVIAPHLFASQGGWPPADMYVTDEDVVVELAIPGAAENNINISVTGDTVTVAGEVRHQHEPAKKGQSYFNEIWQGKFQRSFALPIQVDANKAEATFERGILTLTLPKSEATRPRKIQVRAATGRQSASSATQSGQSTADTQDIPVNNGP